MKRWEKAKPLEKVNRKEQIIQAARELFYDEGFTNTTLELIASNCGIQKQLITYYFKTKEELAFLIYRLSLHDMYYTFKCYAQRKSLDENVDLLAACFLFFSRYYTSVSEPGRFYKEFIGKSLVPVDMLTNTYHELETIDSQLPEYTDFLDFLIHFNSAMSLIRYYGDGKLAISKDDFEYHFFLALCSETTDFKERIFSIWSAAAEFLSQLHIECGKGFKISISEKE